MGLRDVWFRCRSPRSLDVNVLRQRLTPNGAMQQTLDLAAERGYATT